jgi:hypothetical protein
MGGPMDLPFASSKEEKGIQRFVSLKATNATMWRQQKKSICLQ